jgi:uncharacterized membrane protein YdjX (TVP38/TMEM64 family)
MTASGAARRHLYVKVAAVAIIVAAVVMLARNRELFQVMAIQSELKRFGVFGPIVFIAIYAVATVAFVPGSILTLAGGAIFGAVFGAIWNLLGATLGATGAFLIARYVAGDWVARRAGGRLAALVGGVEEEGWRFVAFVRLAPIFPFNLVNYAFGLTRVSLAEYIIASVVCMAPGVVAYTYLGYAGRTAAAGEAGAIKAGIVALALLGAVAFLPRFVRRYRRAGVSSRSAKPADSRIP